VTDYVSVDDLAVVLGAGMDQTRAGTAVAAANQLIEHWTGPADPPVNLLPSDRDASYETAGPTVWHPGTGIVSERSFDAARDGIASWKLTRPAGSGFVNMSWKIAAPVAETTMQLLVSVRSPITLASGMTVNFLCMKSDGTVIVLGANFASIADEWVDVRHSGTVPVDTAAVDIVARVNQLPAGTAAYIDRLGFYLGDQLVGTEDWRLPSVSITPARRETGLELAQTLYRRHAGTGATAGPEELLAQLPAELVAPIRELLDADTHRWGIA
jgi:hypothetical protein